MEAVKKGSDFYIPTYVINMKERLDRKKHIIGEFKGRDEFDVTYMDACTHTIGAVGLWNSIVRIIRLAIENEDDVIVICEDDHYFTEDYSKNFLIENYCCPVKLKKTKSSCSKPFIIGLRGFIFKKQDFRFLVRQNKVSPPEISGLFMARLNRL